METTPPPAPPMAAVKVEEVPRPSPETTNLKLQSPPAPAKANTNPTAPSPAPNPTPAVAPKETPPAPTNTATATSRKTEPPSASDANTIYIPSYSRWFSWNNIHECEFRFLPEFFDGKSPSKNPRVYKYYRNSVISRFRENPNRKITFTEARKTIIGDVGSIRRVFDFLEAWGLINYSPASASKPPFKWEDKDSKSNVPSSQSSTAESSATLPADFMLPKKRVCSGCKSACSIACFACDKYDLTLCARCYVRGNYGVGLNSSDFRRVEISEEVKADWTDKETLHLLEAMMHFGDDWKKVSEYVGGGRSESECVAHFIKLPFGEQFAGTPNSTEVDDKFDQTKDLNDAGLGVQNSGTSFPKKRLRLNPLIDTSNPIMAQAAFLSALGGVEVAEIAARAAVEALSGFKSRRNKDSPGSLFRHPTLQEPDATSNGDATLKDLGRDRVNPQTQLEQEEQDLEIAISCITDVQMKEIQDKISHFEEFESQMEREWKQLQQMKNLLFVDQLNLLFDKTAASKAAESTQQSHRTE